MNIVIAGATGFVGSALSAALRRDGHRITVLSRRGDGDSRKAWDPARVAAGDAEALASLREAVGGAEVVINLAGASIGDGRLTTRRKAEIVASRVDSTRALGLAIDRGAPPKVWLQASGAGYYGDTGETVCDERQPKGSLFLSDVCEQWEGACQPFAGLTRIALLRLGVVLHKDAPAWQKMILPIKLGAGGPLGSGQQWMGWITLEDSIAAMRFVIDNEAARGPLNFVAGSLRQLDLAKLVAKQLGRPAFVKTPAFALRALLGELADNLVLASCNVVPTKLLSLGFHFAHPTLPEHIGALL